MQETGAYLDLCLDLVTSLMTEQEFEAFATKHVRNNRARRPSQEPVDRGPIVNKALQKLTRAGDNIETIRSRVVQAMLQHLPENPEECRNPLSNPGIKYLAENLKLTADEIQIIYMLFLLSTPDMQWAIMEPNSLAEFVAIMAQLSGLQIARIRNIIRESGTLLAASIIEINGDHFDLEADVQTVVAGNLQLTDFQSSVFCGDEGRVFSVESFDVDPLDTSIIRGLLQATAPCNILFKGRPGSGKTELARSLIRSVGREIMHVPVRTQEVEKSRLGRLHYATFFAAHRIIIVDEAEAILNTEGRLFGVKGTGTPTKAGLNMFFDCCQAKIIWIVNDSDDIHESVLRRFHFKLSFDKLSCQQREQAIGVILRKHGHEHLNSAPFMKEIANDESISPGIFDNVVHSYTQVISAGVNISAEKMLPRLLMSHKNPFNSESGLSAGDDQYQLDVLNTSGPVASLVETAKAFYAQKAGAGGGLNVLLHGLPGTGKTEFVKYVARQTRRDLVFKRGSDLLSMWLGSTEKQIASAFREAENRGAVLLIDEADTFFQSRESAQRSWEVSQTNEFLNQMESHKTMLFCCTNLIDRLDTAAMRRFHFKIEFRAMREDKRAEFFTDYFRGLLPDLPMSNELQRALSRLTTLTPGDFRAVKQRFSYKAPGTVSWEELVSELELEGTYKKESQGRTIGF